MTYKTYQEAKIANPESVIVQNQGNFAPVEDIASSQMYRWGECNPADYCMTVEKFLNSGHKAVAGDWYIIGNGNAEVIKPVGVNSFNAPSTNDNNVYILHAKALEQAEIDTTPNQVEGLAGGIEWDGDGLPPVGLECEWIGGGKIHGDWGRVIVHAYANGHAWIEKLMDGTFHTVGNPAHFRKIETPEQKEERERNEAAYDLLNDWFVQTSKTMPRWESVNEEVKKHYLAIVDKTNYRKQ